MANRAELNEAVARLRGWTFDGHEWSKPNGHFDPWAVGAGQPPPYCSDWRLAGPLLEELLRERDLEKHVLFYGPHGRVGMQYLMTFEGEAAFTGDTLPAVIAEAWLAWKKANA